jgi:hypothetical protein
MKIKKVSAWLLCFTMVLGVFLISARPAFAQTKVIRKNVTKVITPEIAPAEPPEENPAEEVVPDLPPPPPPPPDVYETESLKKDTGLFGWGLNTDIGGHYLLNRTGQEGLLGVIGVKGDLVLEDPLHLGSKIGLSEDAFEYKLGLGINVGNDINNEPIFSIPLYSEMVVYLKEGSLFGLDPFVGAGLNFNIMGTDGTMGGMGVQLFGGILADFGFESGKTGLSLGYSTNRVGDIRSAEGLTFSVTQPLIL